MATYKRIVEITNGQLETKETLNDKIARGTKHKELISRLFPDFRSRRSRPQRWVTPTIMNTLFYDPTQPCSFPTLGKLRAVVNGKKQNKMLSTTGFYYRTHTHYTNLFGRNMKRGGVNPCTVTNINEVWELDLVAVQSLGIYNDNFKYLFSKCGYSVPLCSKTGFATASAFETTLARTKGRRIWVRTDKG